jgi:hypothetical protein
LNTGASRDKVVASIESSTEYRTNLLNGIYQSLLGRPVDPAGLATFLNFLTFGGTPAQVKANILTSPEYYQRAGGTNLGFLANLSQDVLGRALDASGEQVFSQDLQNGISRLAVVNAVLYSSEADEVVVNNYFQRFLKRQADPLGMTSLANALQNGVTDDQVIATIAGSGEYLARIS